MKKLLRGFNLIIFLLLALNVVGGPALFAQTLEMSMESQPSTDSTQPEAASSGDSHQATDPSQENSDSHQLQEKALKRAQFLQNIRDELRDTQRNFYDTTKNMKDFGSRLETIQTQVTTLRQQLDNLDQHIALTEDMIENVTMQIGEKENQLLVLYNEIELKKVAIENQKQVLLEYLDVLYEQESSITDTTLNNEEISVAKLLLSNESVGEQLQQIKYFNILENTGHQIFDRLDMLLQELKLDEKKLEESKTKLAVLNERLEEEKNTLKVQREAKAHLLEQTKGEEKIYQQLYEESKRQQDQIQEDIKVLKDNLGFIQEKMEELGENFNPEDYKNLLSGETISVYGYIHSTKDNDEGFSLRWPVSASRGISAYFRDESYRKAFGVGHNAIDIRVPQGTLVKAPADGVVYKVRDNGFGYSYLILAHEGGFMTVYGHVGEFRVKPGEKVYAGQIVAVSGGTPGTKGAGLMTTGAHLHFEVMKGGKYVDPLDYLPLSFLPFDTLPEKYRNRVTGDASKVKRITEENKPFQGDNQLTQAVEMNGKLEELVKSQSQQIIENSFSAQ